MQSNISDDSSTHNVARDNREYADLPSVQESLNRIRTLMPYADWGRAYTDEELDACAERYGMPLPDDLRLVYKFHSFARSSATSNWYGLHCVLPLADLERKGGPMHYMDDPLPRRFMQGCVSDPCLNSDFAFYVIALATCAIALVDLEFGCAKLTSPSIRHSLHMYVQAVEHWMEANPCDPIPMKWDIDNVLEGDYGGSRLAQADPELHRWCEHWFTDED
ncbi:hypothetical protein HDU89_008935 [Geranomyces variabilis]|nr:hypothetical protein HDU89_008935 [Geranomyces variabilis]